MERKPVDTGPDIFCYLNYRAFLLDWFTWRKTENKNFSHRVFARLAGQRSPSLLKHVIDGRRNLTPATMEAFASAMKLPPSAAAFFTKLVALEQATTPKKREICLSRILATQRFREASQLKGEALQVFDHWYFSAILEMVGCEGFQSEPSWIAQNLRPRIRVKEARQALDILTSLGLITKTDGHFKQTEAQLVTPHEVADVAANHYHLEMLDRAKDAIYNTPPQERHMLGLTVSIPATLVPELKQRLNQLQEEMLSLCEQSPKEQVYQVNLSLFPLSEPRSTS